DDLAAVAEELGPEHFWTEADVTDGESIRSAVDATAEHFGRLDTVIANAGLAPMATVRDSDPHAFRKAIDVNLNGVFETARAARPPVIEPRAYVLVVSSLSAFAP